MRHACTHGIPQVEQRRLGLSADIPLAVQQWEGIIAINYAAKGRGVTRHMRVAEARAKCPELRCVHVQTLGARMEAMHVCSMHA